MLVGGHAGGIEVVKKTDWAGCHIAIRVSSFEEACRRLREKGVELEDPIIKGRLKVAWLKNLDPAGNKIHIIYLP